MMKAFVEGEEGIIQVVVEFTIHWASRDGTLDYVAHIVRFPVEFTLYVWWDWGGTVFFTFCFTGGEN